MAAGSQARPCAESKLIIHDAWPRVRPLGIGCDSTKSPPFTWTPSRSTFEATRQPATGHRKRPPGLLQQLFAVGQHEEPLLHPEVVRELGKDDGLAGAGGQGDEQPPLPFSVPLPQAFQALALVGAESVHGRWERCACVHVGASLEIAQGPGARQDFAGRDTLHGT